ncbi:MAG: hypothetical protein Q4A16_04050 [Lautropia sp.]|nr:hypothetical protein [Lautropia sp.]
MFSEEAHWANQPDARRAQSADSVLRRLARGRRIALINRMLAAQRLKVVDWQGSHYQVQSLTGKTELADNLDQIWRAVERISGRPFDPLADWAAAEPQATGGPSRST